MRLSRPAYWLFLIIVSLSVLLMARNMAQPWNGLDATNGSLYSTMARNYLHYGVLELRLGQATNPEPVADIAQLHFHQHHPPGLPLLLAASFAVFGESEAAARLVPLSLTLGSLALLFAITRRVYGEGIALAAAMVFASFPSVLFFARMPGFEPPSLFFILLALWGYLNYLEAAGKASLLTLYLALAAGLMTDWPVYFLVPLIAGHYWVYCRGPRLLNPVVLGLPMLASAMLGVFAYLSWLVNPESITSIVNQGKVYMGLIGNDSPLATRYHEATITFTAGQYIKTVVGKFDLMFAYPLILLALLGLWGTRKARGARETLVFLPLLLALAYCVVFYRSVFIHQWHTYYFAAPFAILAALAAGRMMKAESDSQIRWRGTTAVFLLAVTLSGAMPRLQSLHEFQPRLLPGEQHEPAEFIREIALRIKTLSRPADLVLTNLPNTAGNIVGYYAERHIEWSASLDDTQTKKPRGTTHFLLWQPEDKPLELSPLSGVVVQFSVRGHRFLWLTLDQRE